MAMATLEPARRRQAAGANVDAAQILCAAFSADPPIVHVVRSAAGRACNLPDAQSSHPRNSGKPAGDGLRNDEGSPQDVEGGFEEFTNDRMHRFLTIHAVACDECDEHRVR